MIEVNGFRIDATHFPDGTQQVWKLPNYLMDQKRYEILWRFDSEIELITLAQLYDLLSYATDSSAEFTLSLSYLPYGRQDKDISNEATFGLHTFLRGLQEWVQPMNLRVFDPHSMVIKDYFKDVVVVLPNIDNLAREYDYVCFPDKGAALKYTTTKPVIIGDKERDQATGRITSYKVEGDILGKKILVVDDICDGGATFVLLGQALKFQGATQDLYISHGIFSRGVAGINSLREYFGKIITTDSLTGTSDYSNFGVEVIPCF